VAGSAKEKQKGKTKVFRETVGLSSDQKSTRRHSHEMLEKTMYDLRERVKELNCLYAISSLVEKQGISLEEILQGTVDAIPEAWQYPEITCSRILLKDRVFKTENFLVTKWRQSQPILAGHAELGVLDICYLEEKPEQDEGPFLKEERSLIKVIAERVGGIVVRKQAEAALKESEAHNRAILNAIPDLMFRMDDKGMLLGFHEGKYSELRSSLEHSVGRDVYELVHEERLLPKRVVEQGMTYVKQALATGKTQVFEQHLTMANTKGDFEVRIVLSKPGEVLGIVRDITLRKRLETEILEISGREQRRIGHDLHDSLCQHLAGLGMMAKVLEKKLITDEPVDISHATEMVDLIDQAITITRGFARGLTPVGIEADGLMVALSELAANTERLYRVECRFEHDEPILIDDISTATHLYRIAQEAVNNVTKHGRASRIDITFQRDGKMNILTVKDDGIGIGTTQSQGKGMGLSIMNCRASMIGASLDIRPGADKGTVVVCSFPDRREIE
jgi:signal transduction histidine kinase